MNNARRKAIRKIIDDLTVLTGAIEDARDQVEMLRDEEQDYFDCMPESFQGGEKGDQAQEAINELENAISTLEDCRIEDIIASLEGAAQ